MSRQADKEKRTFPEDQRKMKQDRARKKIGAGKLLAVFLAAFLFFLMMGLLLVFGKLSRLDRSEAERESFSLTRTVKNLLPGGEGDTVKVLLIGSDQRMADGSDIGRGDVTMLCALNKKTGAIKLVSFERSLGVPWPGHGDVMLTSFYRFNGAAATVENLSELFDVKIDGYAHVDFDTFRQIIETIGGVDVELSAEEAYGVNSALGWSACGEGENHMDGAAALAFCRLRAIDDNWNRTGRQRRVIQAILTKSKSLSLSELNELADTVLPLIDTDLSNSEIAGLLLSAGKFAGAETEQMMLPDRSKTWGDYGAEAVTRCDYDSETGRLRDFLRG